MRLAAFAPYALVDRRAQWAKPHCADGRASGRIPAASSAEIALPEAVLARAELAGHGDAAVGLAQLVELLGLEALQIGVDALARAAALGGERRRRRHPHALLVEQPVEQPLGREHRVEQLVVLHRGGEVTGAVPVLLVVLGAARGCLALAALARQLLDHQPASAPVPGARALAAGGAVVARHRQADEGRQLLG